MEYRGERQSQGWSKGSMGSDWASAEVRTGRGQWFAICRYLLWPTKCSALWDSHVPNSQSYQWALSVRSLPDSPCRKTVNPFAHILHISSPALSSPLPLPLIPFLLLLFVFFIASPSHSSLYLFFPSNHPLSPHSEKTQLPYWVVNASSTQAAHVSPKELVVI